MMREIKSGMVILLFMFSNAFAAENRIDGQRPDAPELAKPGNLNVGVRTLKLSNKNQIDVVNIEEGEELPRYNRPLTVEVWYPAHTLEHGGEYHNVYLRDGKTQVTLHGSAVRDEVPLLGADPYPLVIISHGYPGNRFLMSHFGENLASKGYVVASIDHTDSLYQDQNAFASTLHNRSRDQLFVLNEMNKYGDDEDHFLYGMVDAENAGLMGYSMGGYGAMITAGAGLTEAAANTPAVSPQGILSSLVAGSDEHEDLIGGLNFKTAIAFAPWGMERGLWDDHGLQNIEIPMMFITGSKDTTSGYETGTKALFEKTINTERYLLTFENAGHNAIAPIPAPKEAWDAYYNDGKSVAFSHYNDPVWDSLRANNIAQHFVTAYFGKILKNDGSMDAYLNVIDGWKGFQEDTANGLTLKALKKQP